MNERVVGRLMVWMMLGAMACASAGAPATTGTGGTRPAAGDTAAAAALWPIKTREHVDLWLHGYAMLQDDTAQVPFFRRGYRDDLQVQKNRANVLSELDANRERLRARFSANRDLVYSQFVALYFGNWNDLREVSRRFIEAQGDPRAANSQELASAFALLAGNFPAAADREWLRLFVQSLEDESNKFYHSYWLQEQRTRAAALARTDSLWQRVYRPRFQPYLNRTQQESGSFMLSLPLNGEGRTIKGSKLENYVATTYPERAENAAEPIYVFAHEVIAALTATAVNDHVTPSERRSGLVDRITSAAAVRGGLVLVERVAPDLADGYARYYLRAIGRTTGGDPRAALRAAFPLPEAINDAIVRQLDVVLGGI